MKKNIIILIAIFFTVACNNPRKPDADFIELSKNAEKFNSVEEYYEKYKGNVGKEQWVYFKFLNNPYNLNKNNIITIFINGWIVYRGEYQNWMNLKGNPKDIFLKKRSIDIYMEILTNYKKHPIYKNRFQHKSVFAWQEDFNIIYCSFLPTNEWIEKCFFIPSTGVNL